jgi:hypothetical protein
VKPTTLLLTALLLFSPIVANAKPNKKELICANTKVPNKGGNFFYRECDRLAKDPKISKSELQGFINGHKARVEEMSRRDAEVNMACNPKKEDCN